MGVKLMNERAICVCLWWRCCDVRVPSKCNSLATMTVRWTNTSVDCFKTYCVNEAGALGLVHIVNGVVCCDVRIPDCVTFGCLYYKLRTRSVHVMHALPVLSPSCVAD
jgi:hypothetical protein